MFFFEIFARGGGNFWEKLEREKSLLFYCTKNWLYIIDYMQSYMQIPVKSFGFGNLSNFGLKSSSIIKSGVLSQDNLDSQGFS